ncbi:rhodanese-like domain-containing protein [Streptosporangium amethystogenes subsp. fukuiense]|uniref:Rhodanese-like domain-containing protein n=1 Tax=Streptosporangium amethystogenes subsp. fukuiense TaxID=698418 RepID=A0ABW2SSR4_9ACTN
MTVSPEDLLIDPEQATGKLAAGALFVDVRRPEARAEHGLLPTAVAVEKVDVLRSFDRESPELLADAADPDREIVVFCSSERGSGPVVQKLAELGYTNVTHILGGFSAWKEQGFATHPHDGAVTDA